MRIARRLLGFKSLVLIVDRESGSWDLSFGCTSTACDLIDRGEDVGWGPCSTLSDSSGQSPVFYRLAWGI